MSCLQVCIGLLLVFFLGPFGLLIAIAWGIFKLVNQNNRRYAK